MADPDIVFPVRRDERNEELRYALRSLRFLPHGQVWVAGHKPTWLSDRVRHVPTQQNSSKYANSLRNLLTACRETELSEELVLWNDDFFLLHPIDRVPVLHRGTLAHHVQAYHSLRHSRYVRGLDETLRRLRAEGFEDPLSYELHTPMTMDKAGVIEAHGRLTHKHGRADALQIKSAYGNIAKVGGDWADDVKIFRPDQPWEPGPTPFVSTVDTVWGKHPAIDYIKRLHSEPSPYERS